MQETEWKAVWLDVGRMGDEGKAVKVEAEVSCWRALKATGRVRDFTLCEGTPQEVLKQIQPNTYILHQLKDLFEA